jgi:hypothetical protein
MGGPLRECAATELLLKILLAEKLAELRRKRAT